MCQALCGSNLFGEGQQKKSQAKSMEIATKLAGFKVLASRTLGPS